MKEQVADILKSKMALEKCDSDVMPYFTDYYWIPKDEVANLAQEILNLFKAEVEKLTAIDDVEISNIKAARSRARYPTDTNEELIVKAQLQHDKQTLLDLMGE